MNPLDGKKLNNPGPTGFQLPPFSFGAAPAANKANNLFGEMKQSTDSSQSNPFGFTSLPTTFPFVSPSTSSMTSKTNDLFGTTTQTTNSISPFYSPTTYASFGFSTKQEPTPNSSQKRAHFVFDQQFFSTFTQEVEEGSLDRLRTPLERIANSRVEKGYIQNRGIGISIISLLNVAVTKTPLEPFIAAASKVVDLYIKANMQSVFELKEELVLWDVALSVPQRPDLVILDSTPVKISTAAWFVFTKTTQVDLKDIPNKEVAKALKNYIYSQKLGTPVYEPTLQYLLDLSEKWQKPEFQKECFAKLRECIKDPQILAESVSQKWSFVSQEVLSALDIDYAEWKENSPLVLKAEHWWLLKNDAASVYKKHCIGLKIRYKADVTILENLSIANPEILQNIKEVHLSPEYDLKEVKWPALEKVVFRGEELSLVEYNERIAKNDDAKSDVVEKMTQ